MRKSIVLSAIILASGFCSLQAHDLWTNASAQGNKVKAQIGYGHGFPAPELIAEDRMHIFSEGMSIYGINGKEDLVKTKDGKNYDFESKGDIKDGSYIVTSSYKPTYWSQNAQGWKQVDKTAIDKPISCGRYTMLGKTALNVGKSNNESIFKNPIGHALEIVPMGDVMNVKVDEPFKFKVLFEGKPVKQATVTGTPENFPEDQRAFYGTTNLVGEIEVVLIKGGKWMIGTSHDVEYKDKTKCDKDGYKATFSIDVK